MRRAATVVVATLVALLLAEGALRVVEWSRERGWRSLVERAERSGRPPDGARTSLGGIIIPSRDPDVVYELWPELDVEFQGVAVRTNSDGLRGPELEHPAPAGVRTIVGLGDSVMFGWGVAVEDAFLTKVDAALGPSWRVVNTAVPGYNTAMEAARLENGWKRWRPDVVVLQVIANDLELPPFLLRPPRPWSLDRSALWRRIERLVLAPADDRGLLEPWAKERHPSFEDHRVDERYRRMIGIEGFQRAVARVARIAADAGAPVIVLLADDRKPPWDEMAAVVLSHGLHPVTTVRWFGDELERRGLERSHEAWKRTFWLSGSDPHPNAVGHEVLARGLLAALAELELSAAAEDHSP